jgi:hypothetical protein
MLPYSKNNYIAICSGFAHWQVPHTGSLLSQFLRYPEVAYIGIMDYLPINQRKNHGLHTGSQLSLFMRFHMLSIVGQLHLYG